jgi:hypothetical protein
MVEATGVQAPARRRGGTGFAPQETADRWVTPFQEAKMENIPGAATAFVHLSPGAAEAAGDGDGSESHRLQDVLPAIMDLAQKVGGLKQLAEIVATLREAGKA